MAAQDPTAAVFGVLYRRRLPGDRRRGEQLERVSKHDRKKGRPASRTAYPFALPWRGLSRHSAAAEKAEQGKHEYDDHDDPEQTHSVLLSFPCWFDTPSLSTWFPGPETSHLSM